MTDPKAMEAARRIMDPTDQGCVGWGIPEAILVARALLAGEGNSVAAGAAPLTQAAEDVLAERARQLAAEKWSTVHDDRHTDGEMAWAAAAYAVVGTGDHGIGRANDLWPWGFDWWKPRSHRRNLVRSAALIFAEIERLDRAAENDAGDKAGTTQASDSLARPSSPPSPAVRDVTLRETLEVLEAERQGYENLTHSGDQYCRANNIAKEAALYEALKTLRALSHPSLPDGEGNQ